MVMVKQSMGAATIDLESLLRRAWQIYGFVTRKKWKIESSIELKEVAVSADTEESNTLFFSKYDAAVKSKDLFYNGLLHMKKDLLDKKSLTSNRIRLLLNSKLRRDVNGFLAAIDEQVNQRSQYSADDVIAGKVPYIKVTHLSVLPEVRHPILAKGAKLYTVNTSHGTDGIRFEEHDIIGHRLSIGRHTVSITYETASGRGFEHVKINNNRGLSMLQQSWLEHVI